MNFFSRLIKRLNGSLLNSDERMKIAKRLAQDKKVRIGTLYSERNYKEGEKPAGDPREWTDDNIGRGETENTETIDVPIRSTAIDSVEYDPKEKDIYVKYRKGKKRYHFVNMSPQQFKSYMNAGSKGRYTQDMRITNHDDAYPVTLQKSKYHTKK